MTYRITSTFRAITLEPLRQFVIESDAGSRLAPRRLLPGEGSEAFLSWGAPSRFLQPALENPFGTSGGHSVIVKFPEPDDLPPDNEPIRVYQETRRITSIVRVTNPDDDDQFVDVERIEVIDFVGPDGATARFVLNHGGV